MNIRPQGVELFHADGQTDMAKLISAFRNFGNPPKRMYSYLREGGRECFL
jgi:hypothetical protein